MTTLAYIATLSVGVGAILALCLTIDRLSYRKWEDIDHVSRDEDHF